MQHAPFSHGVRPRTTREGVFLLQHRGRLQPLAWLAIGLILIVAVVIALILMNRPAERAYQDAILVCLGVAAL